MKTVGQSLVKVRRLHQERTAATPRKGGAYTVQRNETLTLADFDDVSQDSQQEFAFVGGKAEYQ